MPRLVIGLFLILHGLVHLLYVALSRKLVELDQPLVGWPERSWAFARVLPANATQTLASGLYLVATALFVLSGIGYLAEASWWQPLLIGTAIFSSALPLIFWDGQWQRLPDKGFVSVVINVVILVVIFVNM